MMAEKKRLEALLKAYKKETDIGPDKDRLEQTIRLSKMLLPERTEADCILYGVPDSAGSIHKKTMVVFTIPYTHSFVVDHVFGGG